MGSQLQGSKDCMSVYYENNRSELVKDASTCTAVPKNPWDCRCYSVSGFFLTNHQTFGETRQGWPIFWTNWGRGKSAGEYDGNFPEGLQGFQGPLLILHKVERLCRPMEREGGNLRGNTRRILLRRFQGPSSFKTYQERLSDFLDQCRKGVRICMGIRGVFCWGVFKAPFHMNIQLCVMCPYMQIAGARFLVKNWQLFPTCLLFSFSPSNFMYGGPSLFATGWKCVGMLLLSC